MIGKRFPCQAYVPTNRPPLAAVAYDAETDRALARNPQSVVVRVNDYGYDASVMPLHPENHTTPEPAA